MANFKIEYKSSQSADTITETFDSKEEMITRWLALVNSTNRIYISDCYELDANSEWQFSDF